MDSKLKQEIEQNFAWFIKKTQEFVAIKSFYQKNDSPYPFGENVQKALAFVVNEFKKLKVKTYLDPKGYYGYAEVGTSAMMTGVLAHVDVVPITDLSKWIIKDPFKAEIVDGVFYGRGVIDDKGPIIANLLALKMLLAKGYQFKRRIRFIFGTDEESLWRGINQYMAKEEHPALAYVADATFPLVYAEKGLLNFIIEEKNDLALDLNLGVAFNAVIGKAKYNGPKQEELKKALKHFDFPFKETKEGIIVEGKSAHAKAPQNGINAGIRLLIALAHIGIHSQLIDFVVDLINEDPHALKIFGPLQDSDTGALTLNVGQINFTNNQGQIKIDIRYPVIDCNKDKVTKLLQQKTQKYGLKLTEYDYLPPVYMAHKHPWVQMLKKVYQQVSGDTTSALVATGGATYARAMPNCVSFGPKMPQDISNEHGPNEQFKIDSAKQAIAIYYQSLKAINEKYEKK